MLSNQPVTGQDYFLHVPKMATTVAEELKDPKSLLAIEVQNAIVNRDALLRKLKIKQFQYLTALQAQEEMEDAENEEAAERRKEKQDAMLRQSLEEYYEEQHKIAEQAVAMGEKSLNTYEQLMVAVADYQFKINIITAKLNSVGAQIQLTQANYNKAVVNWQQARHTYVDAYYDTVYQTPITLAGQPFTMDVDRLLPQQQHEFKELSEEAKKRACNRPSPQDTWKKIKEMNSDLESSESRAIGSFKYIVLDEAMEVAYALGLFNKYLSFLDQDEKDNALDAITKEYKSKLNFIKEHRKQVRSSSVVRRASHQVEAASAIMMDIGEALIKLKERQEMLETEKRHAEAEQRKILVSIACLPSTQGNQGKIASIVSEWLEVASQNQENTILGVSKPIALRR